MSAPEFSRPLQVTTDMGGDEDAKPFNIEANETERAALARRFDLLALDSLRATGAVAVYDRGRRARVSGTLVADVVQACVVTLAPVPAHIEEPFDRAFARDIAPAAGSEAEVDIEAEDPPDALTDAGIDLGEVAAESLGLALEPYPRAAGAELPAGDAGDGGRESPFSALKRLKER